MSDVDTTRELEDKLLSDKSFQHILKFAPASQRELMTFELAKYFEPVLDQRLDDLLEAMPKPENFGNGYDDLVHLADVTITIHQLKSSSRGSRE